MGVLEVLGLVLKQRQEVGLCTWLWVVIAYRVDLAVTGGSLRPLWTFQWYPWLWVQYFRNSGYPTFSLFDLFGSSNRKPSKASEVFGYLVDPKYLPQKNFLEADRIKIHIKCDMVRNQFFVWIPVKNSSEIVWIPVNSSSKKASI